MKQELDDKVYEEIRDAYAQMCGADLSEVGPEGLLNMMIDEITDLELENYLYHKAIEYSLTAEQTERWVDLVADEVDKLGANGGTISTDVFDRLLETVKVTN